MKNVEPCGQPSAEARQKVLQDLAASLAAADGITLKQLEKCKICSGDSPLFDVIDFNRSCHPSNYSRGLIGVPIYFHRCNECGFVFTRSFDAFGADNWRRFVYNGEYFATLDPDYQETRPRLNAEVLMAICKWFGQKKVLAADYGGGNGALSMILRNRQIEYYTHDPYDLSDIPEKYVGKFNLISSFEVLEHTTEPIKTFEDILKLVGDRFLLVLSTQCSDGLIDEASRLAWNYVAPRNGHVSVYARQSLQYVPKKFKLDYLPVSRGLHLFGKGVALQPFKYVAGLVKLKQRIMSKISPKQRLNALQESET